MAISRRVFSRQLAVSLLALGGAWRAGADPASVSTPGKSGAVPTGSRPFYFFKNPIFEVIFLTSLGRAYYCGGNAGKVLYLSRQVRDGDFEGAFQTFKQAGDEARALAEESAAQGHKESARQAYLWAQNFYDSATYFVDASNDPTRFLPTWEALYDCWLKSLPLFDPPVEPVRIPYEHTELHGFYFRGKSTSRKRPLLILVNGSDGSLLDMWLMGGAGALARGYDVLTFDGPGQGYALWKQKLYFRPDWEKVISPVIDFCLERKGIDPKKIAVQGISQGGYWVPRAAAFEKRIAAAIADPGVVNVAASWTRTLPKPLLALLQSGRQSEFDSVLAANLDATTKAYLNFRMRPYGFTSYYEVYQAVQQYDLADVAGQIQCPMLVTAPAREAYWPGQSKQLSDLLRCPKTLVAFSESDGADLHCEPQALGLRDLRMFNWLDEALG